MSKPAEFDSENNPATLPINDSVSNLDGVPTSYSSSVHPNQSAEPNRIFLEDNELPGHSLFYYNIDFNLFTVNTLHLAYFHIERHFSSVEEVVEYVGFGWFQLRLMLLTGLAVVCFGKLNCNSF